jgi:hypothetical protein
MNMKTLNRIVMAGIVAAFFAGILAAQTLVVGTGTPDLDISAVQAAVDKGGSVVLKGHFSFDNPPGRRGELPDLMATVLISNEVTISGTWDEQGQITTIDGGEIPFAVEARGVTVKIEGLRFIRPKLFAIFVDAAGGLAIQSCIVEDVQPRLLRRSGGSNHRILADRGRRPRSTRRVSAPVCPANVGLGISMQKEHRRSVTFVKNRNGRSAGTNLSLQKARKKFRRDSL